MAKGVLQLFRKKNSGKELHGSVTVPHKSQLQQAQLEIPELPTELLLEIFATAASVSQSVYLTLLLVSKAINVVIQYECLPYVPIRLQTEAQTRSFHALLSAKPHLARGVRYLWMNGVPLPFQNVTQRPPTPDEGDLLHVQSQIIQRTTSLKAIACPSHVLREIAICVQYRHRGQHHDSDNCQCYSQLHEVTLLDNNLHSNAYFDGSRSQFQLYNQVTHLSVLEPIAEDFDYYRKHFTSLIKFSLELYTPDPELLLSLDPWQFHNVSHDDDLAGLDKMPEGVGIAMTVVHGRLQGHKMIMTRRGRWCVLHVGRMPYYQWWLDRVRGLEGVWAEPVTAVSS